MADHKASQIDTQRKRIWYDADEIVLVQKHRLQVLSRNRNLNFCGLEDASPEDAQFPMVDFRESDFD